MCIKDYFTSWHRQPLFSKKMAAAASFSYKIGGGGLIFQQKRRRQGFGNITGGCSDMVWILEPTSTWGPGAGWWDKLSRKYVLLAGLPLVGVKKKEEPGTGCQHAKFCIEEFSYTKWQKKRFKFFRLLIYTSKTLG